VELYILSVPGSKLRRSLPRVSCVDTCSSKPLEIAKRTAIFTASGQAGSMFAGVMMSAMRLSMDGKAGLRGWQWVFIIGTRTQV
jgi:hypothetical protein